VRVAAQTTGRNAQESNHGQACGEPRLMAVAVALRRIRIFGKITQKLEKRG
jgi:uncharacterized protein YfeS